jgi:hypothetical protein
VEASGDRLEPQLAIQSAAAWIGELYRWILHEKPVELLEELPVVAQETPAFRRRDNPIRAMLPGSYLPIITPDTLLEIAPPDPDWPAPIVLDWIESYGKSFLPAAIMREVYPGRHTAWQYMRHSNLRTCKSIAFPTFEEGWALYAEELCMRSGFKADDPKIRLAVLADLIRADAGLIASVRLHAKQTSFSDTTDYLSREAYWPRIVAATEVDRLLGDPGAACPALGRLEILALREDAKKAGGKLFVPRQFHERLLSFGEAPISILRRTILPSGPNALLGTTK